MPNKELGIADPVYDALRIRSGQSIAPDLGGGSTGGGGVENKIYVWHADGSTLDLFDADTAGLTLALTAWATGDVVVIPACTISGDFTITQTVRGLDEYRSILSGNITLNEGAHVASLGFSGTVTANNGIVMQHCSIATNSAPALTLTGIQEHSPYLYDCSVSTGSTGASDYAVVCTGYCYIAYCDFASVTNTASIDNDNANFSHCRFETYNGTGSTHTVDLVNGRLANCIIHSWIGDGLCFAGGSATVENTSMLALGNPAVQKALLITAIGLTLADCSFNSQSGLSSATLQDGDRAKWNHTHGALSNWFNVVDYGAAGDGTTDDTTAISDAITAIPAGGGVLYFPAGTYKVTSSLTLSKPITVRGDGSAGNLTSTPAPISQINFTQSTGNLFTVSSHGCSFYDVTLFNTSGTTPSSGAGIAVNAGGISARYQNIEVWNFYINIDIQDKQQLWVMDSVLLYGSVKYALKIANPTTPDGGDWFITNSSFFSGAYAADAAIRIESSGGGKITNSKINAAGVTKFVNGIDLAVTAGALTGILEVNNSSIENISGDGIHLRNTATSDWHTIILNGLQFGFYPNTGGHAISIVGVAASHFSLIIIDDCVFRATGSPGSAIDLQYVDDAYIGLLLNNGFSSLLTTSNVTNVQQIGTGTGTVTSIAAGTGITATPDPITATGTIAVADTAVTPGSYKTSNITVDQQGRLTAAANGALDDLSDVNAPTPINGQALIWDAGTSKWIPGTVATTGAINVYNETQSADGVSLTYYLTNYAAPSTIRVYIDGIRQPASDDSAATDIVTFDVAPDAGALLLFDYEMDTA